MKVACIILASCLVLLCTGLVWADWLPEVNLTNENDFEKYTSYNNAWCVAADTAGDVHVVWYDSRGATWPQIHWMERADTTWSGDTVVVGFDSRYPCIAADPFGDVHLVWTDGRGPYHYIYYKAKSSSGWSDDTCISDTAGRAAYYPSLAVGDDGRIHVAWQDFRDGNDEIYCKMRDSTGWHPDERLTLDDSVSRDPCVGADASRRVCVAWTDYRDGHGEVYYKERVDTTWSPDTCLTQDSFPSAAPSIVGGPLGNIHLTWCERRDGNREVYYRRRTGSGWLPELNVTQNMYEQRYPSAAVDLSGNVHLVWHDYRDGDPRIYYKMRDTLGIWSSETAVSAASYPWEGTAHNGSVTADKFGNVHVVWYVSYWDTFSYVFGHDIFYREKRASTGLGEGQRLDREMSRIRLLQNAPNPFGHEGTTVRFSIGSSAERVSLKIYDVSGRLVRTLVEDQANFSNSAIASVFWDGRDGERKPLASGIYFCELSVKGDDLEVTKTRKMVLIR